MRSPSISSPPLHGPSSITWLKKGKAEGEVGGREGEKKGVNKMINLGFTLLFPS